MRTVPEHIERVERATDLYVAAYNELCSCIIEARNDGASIRQLAVASRHPEPAVARIVGEEL